MQGAIEEAQGKAKNANEARNKVQMVVRKIFAEQSENGRAVQKAPKKFRDPASLGKKE